MARVRELSQENGESEGAVPGEYGESEGAIPGEGESEGAVPGEYGESVGALPRKNFINASLHAIIFYFIDNEFPHPVCEVKCE